MKRQTMVFVGNCQLSMLASLYRRIVPSQDAQEIVYLASYENASVEQLRIVAEADIVVRQVLDFAPRIGDLETAGTVHLVPHVTAAFLWPCSGRPHPRNKPHRYSDASGPYNGELGDSYLDRMILDDVPPDEAVVRFMEADIASLRNAGRMQEIVLEKQRSRDAICGYGFADFIDANFRTKKIFRSPNHPETPLSILLASEVFGRLGVDGKIIESMQAKPPPGLFPPTETPIHPSILRHFGMNFLHAESRYRFFEEGSYTCAEFAKRYMQYEWNPLLGEGYELSRNGQRDAAIEVFRRAVQRSPRSAAGRAALSDLLAAGGELDEAVILAVEAHALEPQNAHYKSRLDHITSQLEAREGRKLR